MERKGVTRKGMPLLVAGDVMLGRGVASSYDAIEEGLKDIRATLALCPLVANLESPVCEVHPTAEHGFRADPAKCESILRSFDALSVANNHALDCGLKGFRETIDTLKDVGVAVIGYRPGGSLQEPARFAIDGRILSIIGLLDARLLPEAVDSDIATCDDIITVRREILKARNNADCLICLLHAGDEMTSFPIEHERALPTRLLSDGVDVVVRSHTHTLQGYERTPEGLILYGLGDFIFDGRTRRRAICGIVSLAPNEMGVEFTPYIVHRNSDLRPKLSTDCTSNYPPLVVRYQRVRRGVDLVVYYAERALDILAVQGLGGIACIASKAIFRLRRRCTRHGTSG